MAPKSCAYRQLQQRMRRTLCYGTRRMQSLSLPLCEFAVDYFDRYAPYDYMEMDFPTTLAREGCVDACTFLVAMVYVDRMRVSDRTHFEASDPNDVYLSALVVASKYLHDGGLEEFVYNNEWAQSAGTSLKRVNGLELELLDILQWDVNVAEEDFLRVLSCAERWVAQKFVAKHGFCTYNEAALLCDRVRFVDELLKPLASLLAALCVCYSALAISILLAPQLATSLSSTSTVWNGSFTNSVSATVDNDTSSGVHSVRMSFARFVAMYMSCFSAPQLLVDSPSIGLDGHLPVDVVNRSLRLDSSTAPLLACSFL